MRTVTSVLDKTPELVSHILARARALEGWCSELLCTLIRMASVSGDERDVAGVLGEFLSAMPGVTVRKDGLGSVVARLGEGSTTLAIDGHLDTVAPGRRDLWERNPRAGVIDGNIIYGRGACDQLGGVAAMAGAARILAEMAAGLPGAVVLVGSVMEEDCEGMAWEYLLDREELSPDAVLLTEPTGLAINRGHRGRVELEVSVAGKASHGSQPHLGINAAYGAAEIALEVASLNEQLPDEPLLGKGTVAVTEVRTTAPSLCAVPDHARLHLDRRLTLGETPDSATKEVAELPAVGEWKGEVTIPEYRRAGYTGQVYPVAKSFPTWILPEQHPFLRLAAETYERLFSGAPDVSVWRFSTNGVATMGRHGIPSLGLGPGFETEAHAPNETCRVDHLWRAMAFYAGLALAFPESLPDGWGDTRPEGL